LNDQDLAVVAAVKAGNTEAFRDLVDRHKGRVYAILVSLVGDGDLAEEIAQETFVKAYTGLAGFREEAKFGTWLIQIARHAGRDHRRRMQRRRERHVVSLEALREAHRNEMEPRDKRRAVNPARGAESGEEMALVRQALAELPPDYREVLVLKHIEEWSYEEIAESTGDTAGTLKVRAHRARRMLRDYLIEMGWDPEDESYGSRWRNRLAGNKETNDG
jgi:RNA polymerase sigma-70 factor (ECF subfamily)